MAIKQDETGRLYTENSFNNGAVSDYDKQRTPDTSLTFSLNGRVVFNEEGTLSWLNAAGNTLAVSCAYNYGQSSNYTIIGWVWINGKLIVLSTQNTVLNLPVAKGFSEIGIITESQPGVYTYQTAFNDQYDPNNQLLHLNTRYQAKCKAVFENQNITDIYWADDFNENRVFNTVTGQNGVTIAGVNYFAVPFLPYTTQPSVGNNGVQAASVGAKYPNFYSVHSMSQMTDVQFPLIKYRRIIPGSKIQGVYQYFVRFVTQNRYATPWCPGGALIPLAQPNVNAFDWTQFNMGASGAQTTKGIEIEVKFIDTRYTYIEVAWCLYEASGVTPIEAGVFFQGVITGGSMIISDTNMQTLIPIPDVTVLLQRYTDITHSKTEDVNENYLHEANVFLRPNIQIDTSQISIQPKIRRMISDQLGAESAPVQPLTGQNPYVNCSVNVNLFNGDTETYVVGDIAPGLGPELDVFSIPANVTPEYINYKGTQWDTLFKGRFRGQGEALGLVVWSTKGQPFFAQFLGIFTMPEQYGNTWTLQTINPATGAVTTTTGTTRDGGITAAIGDYTLTDYAAGSGAVILDNTGTGNAPVTQNNFPVCKILGLLVSGIDLTDYLYDQYGNIQLAGFSIVSAGRIPGLLAQGLAMNCSSYSGTWSTDTKTGLPIVGIGDFLSPMHSSANNYFNNSGGGRVGGYPQFSNSSPDHGTFGYCIGVSGNFYTFDSPDNLINPSLIQASNTPGFNIKPVGIVQGTYNQLSNDTDYAICGVNWPGWFQPINLAYTSFYTKNYYTGLAQSFLRSDFNGGTLSFPGNIQGGNNNLGSLYDVQKVWTPDVGATTANTATPSTTGSPTTTNLTQQSTNVNTITDLDNWRFTNVSFLSGFWFNIDCSGNYHAQGGSTQVVIKSNNWINGSIGAQQQYLPNVVCGEGFDTNPMCYYLVNLISNQSTVLNASIAAAYIYKNIGHFVPINKTTIADAIAANTDGRCRFNNVEVWGGDCYVDYFGYGRLAPLYFNQNSSSETPAYYDYGCGLVFPCETIYNHTMRTGNSFPSVGLRPGIDEINTQQGLYNNGLFANVNDSTDVRLEDFDLNSVNQATDFISAYFPIGPYYQDNPDQSLLEMVSNIKIDGETYDSFRYFLVNNNQQADSQYGFITDIESMGINLYVLQEKGFGRIRFNERVLESTAAANLTVGTGQGYQGHDYKGGEQFGCQHQFSVVNNKEELFWVNAYFGKHNRFNGELQCLSDSYGQHSYFTNIAEDYWTITYPAFEDDNENLYDNPVGIGGISAGFDYTNQAELTTFTPFATLIQNGQIVYTGTGSTMEWGNVAKHYEGNWSFIPGIYIQFKQDFLTYNGQVPQDLYVHNSGPKGSFYNVVYPSNFKFIANPGNGKQWLFDNQILNIQQSAYPAVQSLLAIAGQVSASILFQTDFRPEYRNNNYNYPIMTLNTEPRLRGKFMECEFTINNVPNIDVLVTSVKSLIRPDFR